MSKHIEYRKFDEMGNLRAEKVGTAGPFPTGERAQYHVGVWRAVQ